MGGADNFYSQLVGWAKILLPLSAVALLATLFLFARDPTDATRIPVAEVPALTQDQQITAPEFSGLTDSAAVFTFAARSARPVPTEPDTVRLADLRFRMTNPGGGILLVTGLAGNMDGRRRIATFSGLVRLETSTGYVMETNGLTVTLDDGTAVSDGLLEIRAPFGQLTAGQVTFFADDDTEVHRMVFTDGVRLLYAP